MNNSYSLTPQQNIYNETKFYTGSALGNIGGTIEFHMEGLTSEIIEKAIHLLIDAAKELVCALWKIEAKSINTLPITNKKAFQYVKKIEEYFNL